MEALKEFGQELVMQASDECRVLPHILRLIGKGGEHIVFEDLRFPNYVLKVDFIESLPVLYAQAHGKEAVRLAVEKIRAKANLHNERLKVLQSHFSSGSVPLELTVVKDLPINEDVVLSLAKDRNIDLPNSLKIPESMSLLCTIQHKLSVPKDAMNLYSSYAELNRTIRLDYYVEGHRLLAGPEPIGPAEKSAREKIILYIYPSLRPVVEALKTDEALKAALRNYVRRAMDYSYGTGEIIDMAGGGNVVMILNEDRDWQPLLMDALSPPELNFKLFKDSSLKLKHGQELDVHTKANVLNVLNYIRFANAISLISDAGCLLDVPGSTDISPEAWHSGLMIEKYLDVYTPKKGEE